jgi:hypothetical protein
MFSNINWRIILADRSTPIGNVELFTGFPFLTRWRNISAARLSHPIGMSNNLADHTPSITMALVFHWLA